MATGEWLPTLGWGRGTNFYSHHLHRFQSFAPQREGNNAKWYVDGAGYFFAVSVALERAQREIWVLDWFVTSQFP